MISTFLDLTVRVGCHAAYETSVPTPVLFMLRPRLDDNHLVLSEQTTFGAGLPSYEFQDVHGNITCRSMLTPGRNEIRHDALVKVSSFARPSWTPGYLQPGARSAERYPAVPFAQPLLRFR